MSTENKQVRTRDEVESLKNSWKNDPCWYLAKTKDGYEDYENELKEFQRIHEMTLHDEFVLDYDNFREVHVMRVNKGWIYKFFSCVGDGDLSLDTTTFVPE